MCRHALRGGVRASGGKGRPGQASSGCRVPSRTLPAPPRSHVGSFSPVLLGLRQPLISLDRFQGSASIFILGWRSESETRRLPWTCAGLSPRAKFLAASSTLRTELRAFKDGRRRTGLAPHRGGWCPWGTQKLSPDTHLGGFCSCPGASARAALHGGRRAGAASRLFLELIKSFPKAKYWWMWLHAVELSRLHASLGTFVFLSHMWSLPFPKCSEG